MQKKKRFRDYENFQNKNEWQQLIIYVIGNVGLEGPKPQRKKKRYVFMFSPFIISFTVHLDVKRCPCESTLPNQKSKQE